jgi:hypothetical protein
MRSTITPLLLATLLALPAVSSAQDGRELVRMPEMMRTHMRANMRDHLLALQQIQSALAAGRYDTAADVAEQRLGMTSMEIHGASRMAQFMPQAMQDTGAAMHRAASHFAIIAQDAAITRDLPRALDALSKLTAQCTACHAGYRLQ